MLALILFLIAIVAVGVFASVNAQINKIHPRRTQTKGPFSERDFENPELDPLQELLDRKKEQEEREKWLAENSWIVSGHWTPDPLDDYGTTGQINVKEFQKENGLVEDGVVGLRTKLAAGDWYSNGVTPTKATPQSACPSFSAGYIPHSVTYCDWRGANIDQGCPPSRPEFPQNQTPND